MSTNAVELVEPYLRALGPGFCAGRAPDGTAVLSTPFCFVTGDPIEIAAWEDSDGLVLSDRGGLLRSLLVSGVDAFEATSNRRHVEEAIVRRGAELDGATIIRPAGPAGAGAAIQAMIQTLMDGQVAGEAAWRAASVSPETEAHFVVREVLDAADARYREKMRVSGATRRRYPVDFQLAFVADGLVRAVLMVAHDRTLEFAERWNFRFRDIRAARPRLQRLVVVDRGAKWSRAAQRTIEPECEAVFPPGEAERLAEYLGPHQHAAR